MHIAAFLVGCKPRFEWKHMRRREFITLLGGAAIAWPLVARAQQRERMRRIGVLLPATPDDARYQTQAGAFLQELAKSGWSIGRNVLIDTRWATRRRRRRPQAGGRFGCSCARRHPGPWLIHRRAVATGDPDSTDRLCDCR